MTTICDKALDASIAHWWQNAADDEAGVRYDITSECCVLCLARFDLADNMQCFGIEGEIGPCPIATYTRRWNCLGTPWQSVYLEGLHPAVMAWWLEDLKAGRNPPTYRRASSLVDDRSTNVPHELLETFQSTNPGRLHD